MIRQDYSEKSPKQSPRANKNAVMIEQFMGLSSTYKVSEMKTARAVDRIFTQNQLERVHNIFQQIKQNKRSNTNQLRNTLEKNYDRLLDSSLLLQRVEEYGKKIKGAAEQISQHISQNDELDSDENGLAGAQDKSRYQIKYNNKKFNKQSTKKQGSIIIEIEQKLRKNKFYESMKLVSSKLSSPSTQISKSQLYYLDYLKTEIIIRLQRKICCSRFRHENLSEWVKCIHQFFKSQSQSLKAQEIFQKFKIKYGNCGKQSIFGFFIKQIQSKLHVDKFQISLLCFEILLEYKLSILTKQCKDHQMVALQQYFEDLQAILEKDKSQQVKGNSQNQNMLAKILKNNVSKVKEDLTKIFITKKDGQITFRSKLYDQLMQNQKFSKILHQIQSTITDEGPEPFENSNGSTLLFFRELWQTYITVLLDYCIEDTDPSLYLSNFSKTQQLSNRGSRQVVPAELKAYLYNDSPEQSVNVIKNYIERLNLAKKNLLFAFKRSNSSQKQLMKEKFAEKFERIACKINEITLEMSLKNISQDLVLKKFQRYILLTILIDFFAEDFSSLDGQNIFFEGVYTLKTCLDKIQIQQYWNAFTSKNISPFIFQLSLFEEKINKFDGFFIGYLQFMKPEFHSKIKKILSTEIMKMLKLYLDNMQPQNKAKQLLKHTILSLENRKQKITIMDYIMTPYIAKNIFGCEFKPFKIDENVYKKYFRNKGAQYNYSSLNMRERQEQDNEGQNDDDFQIGEAQQKDDIVKIGKSIMNMGNNLINGFTKKK